MITFIKKYQDYFVLFSCFLIAFLFVKLFDKDLLAANLIFSNQLAVVESVASELVDNQTTSGVWYVSKNGSNTDGKTWSTAWNELDQIKWADVQPGDLIYIDGGSQQMDYIKTLKTEKAGNSSNKIYIRRSTESGHDGKVTAKSFVISQPYITVDGLDWNKFLIFGNAGYNIRVTGDYFEIKNIKLTGDFTGPWGTTIYATAPNLTIEHCWFDGNSREDMIKYDPPGSGKITISHSVFMNNIGPADGNHRDVVQTSGGYGFDLEVNNSLFWNTADVILCQSSGHRFGNFLLYNNIFTHTSDVLKLDNYAGADSVKVYNNVFERNRDVLGFGSGEYINNIFVGPSNFNGAVHTGGSNIKNSIWTKGTETYYAGNGNLEADPQFLDITNPLGPDSIPFTADDGFNLKSSSPAIDMGLNTAYGTDIAGNSQQRTRDIGPYEYQGSFSSANQTPVTSSVSESNSTNPSVSTNDSNEQSSSVTTSGVSTNSSSNSSANISENSSSGSNSSVVSNAPYSSSANTVRENTQSVSSYSGSGSRSKYGFNTVQQTVQSSPINSSLNNSRTGSLENNLTPKVVSNKVEVSVDSIFKTDLSSTTFDFLNYQVPSWTEVFMKIILDSAVQLKRGFLKTTDQVKTFVNNRI